MKKKLMLFIALFVFTTLSAPAADIINPVTSFINKWCTFNNDVDTKIALLQKKNAEQQRKYEAKKTAREQKILEQQKKRQEVYEANQKRLQEKREQLNKLLEE